MASPAYEQILKVQDLDLNLRRLRHQHQHHAVRDDIAAVDVNVDEVDKQLAEIDGRHHEVERQRKRLEDEAALIKEKRKDIDNKLYGGEITASKELLALQDEASMLLGKQTELEDHELELMEKLEGVAAERDSAQAQRNLLMARRDDLDTALQTELVAIDDEIAGVEGQRSEVAAGAESGLLASYESLRDQFDGVAVARLVNGTCDGCHIRLSAVAVDQMVKMAYNAVVTCEECGRLLVR